MNTIWPIKSDTSCLLKWGWTTLYLDRAKSLSCHRCRANDITLENFDQFHNTPGQIQDRKQMLDGNWPGDGTGCEYCRDVEAVGGFSDRQFQLNQLQDPGLVAPELFDDPRAVNVTPTMLEVYFKNTCNFSCVYCKPEFSSQIENEYKKFGDPWKIIGIPDDVNTNSKMFKNSLYDEMNDRLWLYLKRDNNYKKLRRYHILGGEPFLLKELDQSIDFFEQNPNPNLVFSLITNLGNNPRVIEKYVKRFEQLVNNQSIWKLQITGSIDGWGPEQEYVRYGLNLEQFDENYKMFASQSWTTMSINSVISALTLQGLPQLIEKVKEWNQLIPDGNEKINLSSQITQELSDPRIFGPGYFENYFDSAIDLLDEQNPDASNALRGLKKDIESSEPLLFRIELLKKYLDEIDQRRGTNWRNHFAWLNRQFN